MSGWLPGRLYRATVRGVPDVLVYRGSLDEDWVSVALVDDMTFHRDRQVTDVRGPLYVLELDEQEALYVTKWDRESTLGRVGRQVAAQIPKPPRMAERGWGSKVRSRVAGGVHGNQACIWLRAHPDPRGHYICQHGLPAAWPELLDPEPVGGES